MKIVSLISAIFICQLAGFLGSLFTAPAIPNWYAGLKKPGFSPPNWLFGPVWLTLYTFMGISLYLIWRQDLSKREVRMALAIFAFQLVLNTVWSFLFFGLQAPLLALVEIVVLWLAIFFTILAFLKVSRPAALLLVPYLFWVSFAALLNFSIFKLN